MARATPSTHARAQDGVTPGDEAKPIVGWSEYIEERNIGVTQAPSPRASLLKLRYPLAPSTRQGTGQQRRAESQ